MSIIRLKVKPSAYKPDVQLLIKLITQAVAEDPYSLDGFEWAAVDQTKLADAAGFSVAKLRYLTAKPPFVRDYAHVGGSKTLLLRVGKPGPKTDRHLANIMSKQFREKTGVHCSPQAYGCLIGLAKLWGDKAPDIFHEVISKWGTFMSGVKLEIALMQDKGELLNGKPPKSLYFVHPNIPTILLFSAVAAEFYIMEKQAA